MNAVSHLLNIATLFILIFGWVVFTLFFLTRKKTPKVAESRRDPASVRGLIMQMIAFALVWFLRRPAFSPILSLGWPFDIAMAAVATALLAGSIWIAITAVGILGQQWSYTARLVEGHALITAGPYRFVRHPIYAGLFGMLLATGLVMTNWFVLPVAIVVFLIGANIRTRSEEKLLRDEFGAAYESYARTTPALIPWPRKKG
jgi:protein-S-isoprenylcysteine O-methyltransferase Ste14